VLSDTTAVAINYGAVESVRTVEQQGNMAAGRWSVVGSARRWRDRGIEF